MASPRAAASSPPPSSDVPDGSPPSQNLRDRSPIDDEFAWLMEILDSFPPPSTLSLELYDPYAFLDDDLLLMSTLSEPDAEPPALSPSPSPAPSSKPRSKRSRTSEESSAAFEEAAATLSPLRSDELLSLTSWAPTTDFRGGRTPLLAHLRPPLAPSTAQTRRSSSCFSCCGSSCLSACFSAPSRSLRATPSTASAATSTSAARLATLRPRTRRRLF